MLIIGAQLESYRSLKDKTLKLTFETQEPSNEQFIELVRHNQRFGFLAFKEDAYKQSETDMLENLKSDYEDNGKTKSQRLKAVLFRNWEQKAEGYEVFDDYYNHKMEKLITHFKSHLD